jgi:hypothetical protein
MTKAEKIRELTAKHPGLSSPEIGKRVGCSGAYVRAVQQRQKGGGLSAADRAYDEKFMAEHGRSSSAFRSFNKYHTDAKFRAKCNARSTRWRKENQERKKATERAYYFRKKAEREASHA